MELQFEKKDLRFLRRVADQVIYGEQTQEVRLPDGMEDIGSVLGAWGQVILRSKEWRRGGMSISGGVTVNVLYAGEEGGKPQYLEAWLPFQMKWDFPDPGRDGRIVAWGLLENLDARSISARKLMLRANVGVSAQAWIQDKVHISLPGEKLPDTELKIHTYPLELPNEAGEKSFELEERLRLPASAPRWQQIVYCSLTPAVLEQKIMGDKLVFRGTAQFHTLYEDEDGKLHSWDFPIPFSQYGELEDSYDEGGQGSLFVAVTSLEMGLEGEEGVLKAGLTCQYVLSRRELLEIVEDGYSTQRATKPNWESFTLPCILQREEYRLMPQCNLEGPFVQVVDAVSYPCHGHMQWENGQWTATGWSQVLGYDESGMLCARTGRWECAMPMETHRDTNLQMYPCLPGVPELTPIPGGVDVGENLTVSQVADCQQEFTVVSSLELGEKMKRDPNRPSLILCRAGDEGLWNLAKSCNTTVQAIKNANGLTQDPAPDRIILIPIA